MKKKIALFFFTIFFFNTVFACLNGDSKELKDGTIFYMDREGNGVPQGHQFNQSDFIPTLKNLESLYKKTRDLDYLSDKGLVLILLKRYDEAVDLYLKIEKIKPNRYSTASNIGTAYELMGQNENALKWIKKAVQINPKSHEGSEWIHVNILKAKIKGEEFYTTNSLLNTDFGSGDLPKSSFSKDKLEQLRTALYYQLNERISFIKPEDKIIAQLVFDLGNIDYLLGNYNAASGNFEQARRYGYSSTLLDNRLGHAHLKTGEGVVKKVGGMVPISKIFGNKKSSTNFSYFIYGSIAFVILSLVFIFYRKKRIRTEIREISK